MIILVFTMIATIYSFFTQILYNIWLVKSSLSILGKNTPATKSSEMKYQKLPPTSKL